MKRFFILKIVTSLLATLLLLFGSLYVFYQNRPLDKEHYSQNTRPTLFFHGFGSSANAEKQMARAAKKSGATKTIIQARVRKSGEVHLQGTIPKNAINPIILVSYEDNKNPDYTQDAAYAKSVITALQAKYHFTEMNMVGHSMGNMSIMFYHLLYGQDKSLPKIMKQVDIAGHFNGIIGYDEPKQVKLDKSGQPNQMTAAYQTLLPLRENLSKNQLDVLNIFGDVGNDSDGRVSNTSSKSLKYLLTPKAKSYKELNIKGKDGQHSALHESQKVDHALISFLWSK